MPDSKILIIGGGPAGLEAARSISDIGFSAVVVEKRDSLGGTPDESNYAKLTHHFRDASEVFEEIIKTVTDSPNIEIMTGSIVESFEGEVGNFKVTVKTGDKTQVVDAGSIIVATGFQHFDPAKETQYYNYYSYPDVITIADLEGMLKSGNLVRPSNGEVPEKIAFIQCVGSRDRQIGNEFCSKVCCGISSKQAIEIRQMLPDSKVMIFYIDMRMYGYWENEIYWPAQEKYKVNYIKGIVSEILAKGDKLLMRGEDATMGRPMEVEMDLVVLAVGMEPSQGTRSMAQLIGIDQNKFGFIEAGGTSGVDPVATTMEGIFVAGAASGPADLDDSFSTGGLAATRAVAAMRRAVPA